MARAEWAKEPGARGKGELKVSAVGQIGRTLLKSPDPLRSLGRRKADRFSRLQSVLSVDKLYLRGLDPTCCPAELFLIYVVLQRCQNPSSGRGRALRRSIHGVNRGVYRLYTSRLMSGTKPSATEC